MMEEFEEGMRGEEACWMLEEGQAMNMDMVE